jgi:hypothetical protein
MTLKIYSILYTVIIIISLYLVLWYQDVAGPITLECFILFR